MRNILDEIVENKRIELGVKRLDLENTKSETQNLKYETNSKFKTRNNTFYKAVTKPKGEIGIIAEIKLASPSAGRFVETVDIAERARLYEEAGADAISIVTDQKYFQGDLDFVRQAQNASSLPVLQKDFVIDTVQIEEAREIGSDALLLIARILEKNQLQEFVSLCQKYGIEPVVEIYDNEDLEKAVKSSTRIIAVNARDLDTFDVDIARACDLARSVPEEKTVLGFSGIETAEDVKMYKEAGARAVLVGGVLMRSGDPERTIQELNN
jgi:indole-3-glycerol phosphate synthase